MSFSFKYKPVRLKTGNVIYRPLVPLTLGKKEKLDVIGILDSGSDMTIIPKEIAEVVGVEYSGDNEVSGITGKPVRTKQGKLSINFGRGRENYFFEIPVLVPEKEVSIIIGRLGLFEQFKITFSEPEKKIIFKKFGRKRF